jgi:hypothetical protein
MHLVDWAILAPMHGTPSTVVGLRQLDCMVGETLTVEALVWCCSDAGFEALAIAPRHVGLEFEEGFDAVGLQDGALALAANPACVGRVAAPPAGEVEVAEIQLFDRTAATTDEKWARAVIASETSTTPTQFDGLIVAEKVICFNGLKRDD